MSAINAYFENLSELLNRTLETQQDALETAARQIANALRDGGMVYTFGTGHGHLLALEIFYRAGGMVRLCPILDEKLMLHISAAGSTLEERNEEWVAKLLEKYPIKAGDVLIAMSNSGRNAVPVLLADEARKRGAYVIALTSMQHTQAVTSRNRLNLRLFEAADLILDNGGVLGDASWQAADGAMVGPTSTAIGAAMLQAIVCRVKELSLEENFEADYFKSSNVDGGDEWNNALIERYKDQIPGLL
jgi:uncharacterized phosphosugar-binding protein